MRNPSISEDRSGKQVVLPSYAKFICPSSYLIPTCCAGGGRHGKPSIPYHVKFIVGGLSGMGATLVLQPLELVKNWMQLSGEGTNAKPSGVLATASQIMSTDGWRGFYHGMSAGLFRQATYTSTRIGIYSLLHDMATSIRGQPPPFAAKVMFGIIGGAVGAAAGTPADVCLIRITSDHRLPPAQRRNYTGVFNALSRIIREEGFTTLWSGIYPTMGRAMVVNGFQLSTYSEAKHQLARTGIFTDGLVLYIVSSMISGWITSIVSLPIDMAKTRIQNTTCPASGRPIYKNTSDVVLKVINTEGFFSLWKGFSPYYVRLGPQSVLIAILYEKMATAYQMCCNNKG